MSQLSRRDLLTGLGASVVASGCGGATAASPTTARVIASARPPSFASTWLDIALEATARDVDKRSPRPAVLSRTLAISLTAMFDAWAAYDNKAVGTRLGAKLRRPREERTEERKRAAISYAMFEALSYVYPTDVAFAAGELKRLGYDPAKASVDPTTPEGIGTLAAREVIASRRGDGSNQEGNAPGGNGEPYSDTTGYTPLNPVDRIIDPDRWQPIAFDDGKGGKVTPGYLTPQWARVRPFALARGDQFRPGAPPKVGSKELYDQAEECLHLNANLTCEQKALVEFMRDGPRSTGQSGHWLRFAQTVSRRDGNDLDTDVKMYFAIANVAFDAFIAAWDAKLAYDSSRPWTLIHHFWKGKRVRGWGGPNKGAVSMLGEDWRPFSPLTFITPPFPGFVSGHSCVSGASGRMLALFTGADRFAATETRACGALTDELGPSVTLTLDTFTSTAEMAGMSRVYGGYHIAADNVEGLKLGRAVADATWPTYRAYIDGTR